MAFCTRLTAFLIMISTSVAAADELKLEASSSAQTAGRTAKGCVERLGAKQVDLLPGQAFRVTQGKDVVGTLVGASGLWSESGRENSTCFLVMVKPDGACDALPTVGFDDWEVETCLSIEAIGSVPQDPATGASRLAVVHESTAPSGELTTPVVVAWNAAKRRLEIDMKASTKASNAGAKSIAEVRKALK